MLQEEGHTVIPLSLKEGSAHGLIFETEQKPFSDIDTVSLYIRPHHQSDIIDYVLSLRPKRVIFNPGTENIDFVNLLKENGIAYEYACTLVLLRLGAY